MKPIKEIDPLNVKLANDSTVTASRREYIHIDLGSKAQSLCRAYLIPDIKLSPLCCIYLDDRGITTKFARKNCTLRDR